MTQHEIKIAIGIPTYNRGDVLLHTIRNALMLDPLPHEIIIVDQSEWYPAGFASELSDLLIGRNITYLRQETPNLPAARNRILTQSICDVVAFIDDDVELPTNFVAAHVANYANSDVSAVCGRITERDTTIRQFQERTWGKNLDYRFFDFGWTCTVNDFGIFKGCNHSVLRKNVLELGGYDEHFVGVAMREEGDMAFRLLESGQSIRFDPAAFLHHLRAPAGGCRTGHWGEWTAGYGSLRFAVKHKAQLGVHFWPEFWHAARLGFLNKKTMKKPWLFTCNFFKFTFSFIKLSIIFFKR
jgi:glycosyltransferase involved in cell wall biosynthesis